MGDWVFLKLQPYRQHSIFRRSSQKLSIRYFGPFQIEDRVGAVAYCLKLPEGSRIHSVFHVSLLKKRVGDDTPTSGTLPPMQSNGLLRLCPAYILDSRHVLHNGARVLEFWVQWRGLPVEEAKWENAKQLQTSFPDVNLEDKVLFDGRGIDAGEKDREHEEPKHSMKSVRGRIPNRWYEM